MQLTRGQVAIYVEISRAHVSDLEKGKSNPSIDLLRRLALYYKTTVDYLLELTEDPKLPGATEDAVLTVKREEQEQLLGDLPSEYKQVVIQLVTALKEVEGKSRERLLGKFMMRMLGDFEDRYGEQAAQELLDAIDLFANTGDDSTLRAWFSKYLGADDFLP